MDADQVENQNREEIDRLLGLVREDPSYRNYWMVSKKIKQLRKSKTRSR